MLELEGNDSQQTEGETTATSAGSTESGETSTQKTEEVKGQTKQADPPPEPKSAGKTFDQEAVNTLVGQARTDARDRFLKDIGVTDADALKQIVSDFNEQRAAQMSDLEKANEELERLRPFESSFDDLGKELKKANKTIEGFVNSQIELLNIPDHIVPLLEGMSLMDRLEYLTEHGSKFDQQKIPKTGASDKGGTSAASSEKGRKKKVADRYGILQ
jgi:hypothetical protein